VIAALGAARGLAADVQEQGAMPFPAILVANFSAGLYVRSLPASLLAPVMSALAVILGYGDVDQNVNGTANYAILFFLVTGVWGAGRLVRHRALQAEAAEARAPEMAREAVAEERARIARELHDIVAHSVSIVAMQAGAAEELVEKDPKAAREHLHVVRTTAREAMVEMRRLLDVLREQEPVLAPQPTLERVEELVEDARAAGVPVVFEEEGERPAVPPGIDLAAFRMVQEALTNVRKHAGSVETTVQVRYRGDGIELSVVNGPGAVPASANGGGHGLVGMRERARLYGGRVDAAPLPDGGFSVHAWLPLEEDASR
jgi:signal transduction histidine kinase